MSDVEVFVPECTVLLVRANNDEHVRVRIRGTRKSNERDVYACADCGKTTLRSVAVPLPRGCDGCDGALVWIGVEELSAGGSEQLAKSVDRCGTCGGLLRGGHERDGSDHCWGHDDEDDAKP